MLSKKQFKTAVAALFLLYALIFAARLAYDFAGNEDLAINGGLVYAGYTGYTGNAAVPDDPKALRPTSNVASLRKEYAGAAGIEVLDQKYEQIASVSAKTASYDSDLAKLDSAIEQSQAVVQTENAQGLAGARKLARKIGVKPQYFDACLESVKRIGVTVSSTAQKIDKTYEYRQMLAQKQELEKRLESYAALRSHGGTVNELLSLEDKIIEVESQILSQSVDLGEYSDDNALCTINFSLYEGRPAGLARRVWNAFVWSGKCYFALLGGIAAVCLAAALLVTLYLYLMKKLTGGKTGCKKSGNGSGGSGDDGKSGGSGGSGSGGGSGGSGGSGGGGSDGSGVA